MGEPQHRTRRDVSLYAAQRGDSDLDFGRLANLFSRCGARFPHNANFQLADSVQGIRQLALACWGLGASLTPPILLATNILHEYSVLLRNGTARAFDSSGS